MTSEQCLLEDLVGCRGHRQRLAHLLAQIDGQPHILLLMLEGKVWGEVPLQDLGALQAVHGALQSTFLQNCHNISALEPGLRPKSQPLAERFHVHGHDHVHNQLHSCASTNISQEEGLLAHHVEARLGFLLQRLVSCRENDKLPIDGWHLRTAHRGLDEETSLGLDGRADVLGGFLVDCRHVDELFAWRDASQHTLLSEDNLASGLGIGRACENDVALLDDFLRCVGNLGTLLGEFIAARLRPVPQGHIKASINEAVCHCRAHDAHAQISDSWLRHVVRSSR
mmetsp:Transcript_41638/g.89385  ORF Transcript_41638/g.89385 Transcript_41638/m.89385 type:complete len:282 (+) Transcript_41638:202-1047(+)